MKAALVTSFDAAPSYSDVPEPVAAGAHEAVVEVLAAGLHPRVRSQAAGSHYTSTDELPLVPGVDGVGRDADGTLRYFLLADTPHGSMAERVVIDTRRSVVLPAGADPVVVAAAMNPAMSSWVALRRRITVPAGANVLVLGATGAAGRMAVQVARRLGAATVVAVGRDPDRLALTPALGASATVCLASGSDEVAARLAEVASAADVVLDYVWGETAAAAMVALVTARADRGAPLHWVQIGSTGGAVAPVPSAALRASGLTVVGSGQGSVRTADIAAELADLAAEITGGAFTVDARAVPLSQVGSAWADTATTDRLVLVP